MGVVSGSHKVGTFEFKYQEQQLSKGGAGSRGIQIGVSGSKKGVQKYKFDPNPHDNPKYNKAQSKFYEEAAKALADYWVKAQATAAKDSKDPSVAAEGKFPRYGTFKLTALGTTYKLVAP